MQRLGRYQILQPLGKGGMGIVYLGTDTAIGRPVAVKTVYLSEQAGDREAQVLRARLLREARAGGTLSHPNIVTVYDLGQEGDITYIVMEYVKGRTLEQLLTEEVSRPVQEESLRILADSADALDYAHSLGVVHRDVKPTNIMIREDGTVKLTDFGIAKLASGETLTGAGVVVGSAHYLSPEQLKMQPVSGRTDQFSLAVIAYNLLTGHRPFEADTVASLFTKILFEDPPSPHSFNPALGPEVEAVLRRAMSKEPADRFESCTAFAEALTGACRRSAGTVTQPIQGSARHVAPSPALTARFFRSRWFQAIIAAGCLLALGAVGWHFWDRQQDARYWGAIEDSVQVELFEGYLRNHPQGMFAEAAQARIRDLRREASEAQVTPAPPPPQPDAIAPPPPPPPPETVASARPPRIHPVQVTTSPPEAEVLLDNDPRGACRSPCFVQLSSGRHTLTATLPGYRTEHRILDVARPLEVFVSLPRVTGTVWVETTPPGAQIILNGQLRPETTPARLVLPAGNYELAVMKDGIKNQDSFEMKDNAMMRLFLPLSQ
ncbi:MAG: serine/threonine-protein kinase [Acidobacteriota bacterium]